MVKGTKEIAPLTAFRDLDKLGLLNNVTTFNFHPALCRITKSPPRTQVGAVSGTATHRSRSSASLHGRGNKEFNCLLWMPPNEQRAGDILLIDSTHFTTLFGGTDSLANLWRNLALMK